MANMRVVSENHALTATITASSTAGSLVASNLATSMKSQPWRSGTGTTATITVVWTNVKTISCVALPFCNLSATATMRVRLYTNSGDANPVSDTGNRLCSAGFQGTPTGVNSYAYAGGAYATVWTAPASVRKVVIDISDTGNPLNYIEASMLVCGAYWSPTYNADYDPQLSLVDRTENERTDAGDLRSDRGTQNKVLSFDISFMTSTERNQFWNIMKNGKYAPVFVSLLPETGDTQEEHMYTIYGKLSNAAAVTYKFMNQHATQMEIEEI